MDALLKILNNFSINKCENCDKLFIPVIRMYGLHYNHQKKFTEKEFKECSKKAHKLKDNYDNSQIE